MLSDKYISYISSIRRYSGRTAEIYRNILEDYLRSSCPGETYCDEDIAAVMTPDAIRNYEVRLMDEKKESSSTVNLALSVLSGFARYLVKEGVIGSNPCRLIPRPKRPRRLPGIYRKDAIKEYFELTRNYVSTGDMGMKERYEARLRRIIISLLYNTGMRRSELITLKVSSVDFARKTITVHGKGDKMREIPMVNSLCNEISLYLQSVETMIGCERSSDNPLLVTTKGGPLYPVYVDRAVKEELGKVGSITGRKSPHSLRHTIATELLDEGTDINCIKELLGHSSLAATEVYTHNSIAKLQKVYNNAHPRAKNGGKHGDSD